MRDIRFRGKNIITNKWVYGHYMEQPNDFEEEGGYFKPIGIGSFISDCNLLGRNLFAVDSETIGQYTGLKDIYNKEIYEGDILNVDKNYSGSYTPTYVLFYKGTFMVQVVHKMNVPFLLADNVGVYEIIGNKYENAELLEEK